MVETINSGTRGVLLASECHDGARVEPGNSAELSCCLGASATGAPGAIIGSLVCSGYQTAQPGRKIRWGRSSAILGG